MIRRIFEIDLRSLGLFRIVFGLVVLGDLLCRLPYWLDFYGDIGILPRVAVMRYYMGDFQWSFHLSGGSAAFCYFMFCVHAVLAILFILGWRARLTAVFLWLFTYSLQNRNLLILNGGDALERLILFWAIFLPLGDRFSLDSGWSSLPGRVFSMGTVAIIVQVLLVYGFSVVYKTGDSWRVNYDAIWLSLSNPELATSFGFWLSGYTVFCKALTICTVCVEVLAPLLIVARLWWLRVIGIAFLAILHIGIALTLTVGVFSFVCLAFLCLFLPSHIWQLRQHIDAGSADLDPFTYNMLTSSYCAAALIYVLAYNVSGFFGFGIKDVPGSLAFRNGGGLGQRWAMYAPDPPLHSYRLDVIGEVDGRKLYVGNQRPYGNSSRWRTYLARLRSSSHSAARPYYITYLQRVALLPVHHLRMVSVVTGLRDHHTTTRSLGGFPVSAVVSAASD